MPTEYRIEVNDKNEKLPNGFRCRMCFWRVIVDDDKTLKEETILKTTWASNMNKALAKFFFPERGIGAWNDTGDEFTEEKVKELRMLATQQSNSTLWADALKGDTIKVLRKFLRDNEDVLRLTSKIKKPFEGKEYWEA